MAENKISLPAQLRDSSRRRGAKKTSRDGMVAGVVYGPNTAPFTIMVDPRDLATALTTPFKRNAVIMLEVDGKTYQTMLKDTQFDAVRREITHFDLCVVTDDQKIVLDVPVRPLGRSAGEKLGGLLQIVSRNVKIACAVKDIPECIEHDVTALHVSDQVYVDEMAAPEGSEIRFKHRYPVILIASRRGAVKKTEEEAEAATA